MADAPAEAAIPPAPIVARVEPPAPTHPPQIAVVRLPVAHDDGPVEMLAEEVDEGPVDVDVEIVALPEPGRRERALRRGSGSPGSTLAMETRILRGARAELRAGNLAEANALLARHRDRFPRGMLVDLRAALEIDAQCRLGHTARAHALAGAFERTYPGSPYRARATNCDPADGGQP
jgi:hypothetical protein